MFVFLVPKLSFCVNLIQKFQRVILRRNLVPTLEFLIDARTPSPANYYFDFFPPRAFFFHPLTPCLLIIGESFQPKFETMLAFWWSRKRSDLSVVCFVLQVCAKKSTQCFVLLPGIKKPTYCLLLTSFRRSNRMFVDVFIKCVAWCDWWTWCVLPTICNSKHFRFFVFYFNISNKISSTQFQLLNF